MSPVRRLFLTTTFSAILGCASPVGMPPVHEPLDSAAWRDCADELSRRESLGLFDDMTLDKQTLVCRGVVAAGQGKIEEGLDLLNEAAVLNKEDHRPYYLSGRILAEAGRYREALTAFEKSQRRFASMEVPSERLGRKVLEEGGAQEALAFLLEANGRHLCPYGCQGLLARLFFENKEPLKAVSIYKQMIVGSPDEPAAYVGLASVHNSKKEWSAELENLEKAIGTAGYRELSEAQRASILYSASFAAYNGDKSGKAARLMDDALALDSSRADWYVLAGWIAMKRFRPEEAVEYFETAGRLDPKLVAAMVGQGDAYVQSERYPDAIAAYERAQKKDPGNAVVLLKLALALGKNGDKEEGQKLLDKARGLDQKGLPPDLLASVAKVLGTASGEETSASQE